MKVVAIIQARMGSTRLPGKVLKKIVGKPLLELLYERLRESKQINKIVVATSKQNKDKKIVDFCKKQNISVFTGSENDVLDRFYQAAKKYNADIIVRITGDCPLHDPKIIDDIILYYLKNKEKYDYVSNVDPPTFPDGFDFWVFPFKTLEKAWKEAKLPSEREHVCPYIWKNRDIFKIGHYKSAKDYSNLRWTVDDQSDFEYVKKIFEELYIPGKIFSMDDILKFIEKNPNLEKLQEGKIRDEGLIKSIKMERNQQVKQKLKILITGANGLLGSNLCKSYQKDYKIIATDIKIPHFKSCINKKLDITSDDDMDIILQEKPDIVINCAALVNVDLCEKKPRIAENINAKGAGKIAKASKKAGSYLIHISTDAVFDGKKGNYFERDKTNPINVYGKTKLKAEELIKKISDYYSIVRTNIYGWNHENKYSLAEWMLDKLENNEILTAFKDIYFNPIIVTNLAPCLLELKEKGFNGIIHIAGSEKCSKLEFAYHLAEIFNLNKDLIKPISYKDIDFAANRSEDMSLNCSKAQKLLNTRLLDIKSGLRQMKKLKENGYLKKLKKT